MSFYETKKTRIEILSRMPAESRRDLSFEAPSWKKRCHQIYVYKTFNPCIFMRFEPVRIFMYLGGLNWTSELVRFGSPSRPLWLCRNMRANKMDKTERGPPVLCIVNACAGIVLAVKYRISLISDVNQVKSIQNWTKST